MARITMPQPITLDWLMGRTVSTVDGCKEWPGGTAGGGYCQIRMRNRRNVLVHRLAYALAFEPIPPGLVVRHTCDNPKCCNPQHLVLGTQADNVGDAVSRGRVARGERQAKAKLTAEQVLAIRVSRDSQRKLAKVYGVSGPTICAARTGRTWKHVDQGGPA